MPPAWPADGIGLTKHTAAIFTKLDLQQSDDDKRRVLAVLAVLAYLGEQ
jgi:hypothetical protein